MLLLQSVPEYVIDATLKSVPNYVAPIYLDYIKGDDVMSSDKSS